MLRGVTELSLDAKGRMALPAGERERVKADYGSLEMVLTINIQDRCLWLYPLQEWEEVEQKLTSLSSLDKNMVEMKRLLLGHAKDLSLDGQGRVAVPSLLRQYASLDKKVILLGLGNKYEIWDYSKFHGGRETWIENQAARGASDEPPPDVSL